MKKIITILMTAIMSLSVCACNNQQDSSSIPTSTDENQESIEWMIEETLMPFWKTNKIKNESILLVSEEGGAAKGELLFTPKEIISVISYDVYNQASITYVQGTDFGVEGKTIKAISEAMPFMTAEQLSGKERLPGFDYSQIPSTDKGLYLPFTEGTGFIERQIYVTYTYEEEWDGTVPSFAGTQLPKTMDKLLNKKDFQLMVYGDSISTGANSTSILNVYPYEKSWPDAVHKALEDQYGMEIGFLNKSVGGWTSENAIKSTESIGWVGGVQISQSGIAGTLAEMPDYKPDLVILGFGMNDATNGINKKSYKLYMQRIITLIRERNPDCEFILLGTMIANPKAYNQSKDQISYFEKLEEISSENEGIVAVNIGQMHTEMLAKGKKYADMTGNNVNHPKDFMAAVYSMNILSLLIGG